MELVLFSVVVLVLTLLCVLLVRSYDVGVKKDTKSEPYRIPCTIPYFGHLLGILWYRNKYYSAVSARYEKYPIYTLPILNARIYVINRPDLVLAAQRQPRVISFWQVEVMATTALGGLSSSASDKLKLNLSRRRDKDEVQGQQGLLLEGLNATHRALAPGSGSQQMFLAARETIAEDLNALSEKITARLRVDLWQWVKHEVTRATTESVYGPMNPYRDLAVEDGFWDFASDTMLLLSGPSVSRFLAPKGCKGRARVVDAFLEYYRKSGHDYGSSLVKARFKVMEHEMAPIDIARLECVWGVAILVNSVLTAFWTLWHVFSNCEILHAVRAEVDVITSIRKGQKNIALGGLNDLPVLAATIQETLRYRSCGVGARIILENTVLDNRYELKKGSYVMFDIRALHMHEPSWGPSSKDFDWRRFTKNNEQRKIQRSGAFQGFGGGANLCPGKDFATSEIMALVALFVASFDMVPEAARWSDPQQDLSNVSLAISPPLSKVTVQFFERKGHEGIKLAFGI